MKFSPFPRGFARFALLSFVTLSVSAFTWAAAPGAAEKGAASPYEQAVASYIDGATKEVAAFRAQIESVKDPELAKRYISAKEKLTVCEATLEELRTASRSRFDPLKAEYERGRTALLKELEAARK
jgi:hypothetical protein